MFYCLLNVEFCIVLTTGISSSGKDRPSYFSTLKQRQFLKDEFHYLNVTRVGMFTSHDLLDCTWECVRNTLCLSINVAASKGADGNLWCELLSSDKYRDAENYKDNRSNHHFFITVGVLFSFSYLSYRR